MTDGYDHWKTTPPPFDEAPDEPSADYEEGRESGQACCTQAVDDAIDAFVHEHGLDDARAYIAATLADMERVEAEAHERFVAGAEAEQRRAFLDDVLALCHRVDPVTRLRCVIPKPCPHHPAAERTEAHALLDAILDRAERGEPNYWSELHNAVTRIQR